MNAQQYFEDFVIPTYMEFEQDRSNRRRALLASLVLHHLLDYVNTDAGGNKGNLGNLQKTTRERCASFKAIEALANGTKHVEIRGPDRFSPDCIVKFAGGAVLDRLKIGQNTTREFKTVKPMLWFEFHNQRHFVDVDLFATLKYLASEFKLVGADNIEPPMQLVYKDTTA